MYYWAITIVGLAIFSLLRRLRALRLIPTEELVKMLNIDIPKSSKISIDNVTKSEVFIHWEIPTVKENIINVSKIAYFILFINDKQLLVLNPTEKNACLSDLLPDTCYKLDLITVNTSGYRAKSESVHIRTKSTKIDGFKNKAVLENPESLFKLLTFNQVDVSSIHKISTPLTQNVNNIMANGNKEEIDNDNITNANTTANASSNFGTTLNVNPSQRVSRSRSNTVNSDMRSSVHPAASTACFNLDQDPREIFNIDDLRWYLESGQEVLRELIAQQEQTLVDFKESEALLVKERDGLRERVKLGINNKKALVSEVKMLEDSRRLIELKKKKIVTNLEKRKNNIEQKVAELAKWNTMLDEFDAEQQKLSEMEKQIHLELDEEIKTMETNVFTLQANMNEVEEEYKRFNHKRRHYEAVLPVLTETISIVNRNMDQSGCINLVGIQALEALKKEDEDIYKKLKDVVDEDSKLEAQWRAEQQKEVYNCMQVSKAFDVVKSENHQIKQVIQSQALKRQASSSTPPQNFVITNPSQITPVTGGSNSSNHGSSGFSYPSLMNPHSNMSQASYNYEILGSNPSLNSFSQTQQQKQQQQVSSQFSNTSPWQNHRSTSSYPNNVSQSHNNSNSISLGLSSIANNMSSFEHSTSYEDPLDSQQPASHGFLPSGLIYDEINSDAFFNSSIHKGGMFSSPLDQMDQTSSSSTGLVQNGVGVNVGSPDTVSSLTNTSTNLHYNHGPKMNEVVGSGNRSLFLGNQSSNFTFDNATNVNSGLLGSSGHHNSNLVNTNPPSPPHEFLSAHNSPNQIKLSNDLNSLTSIDGTNTANYNTQASTGSMVDFGNTIDSFVTASSGNVLVGNETLNSSNISESSNTKDSHSAGSFPRRFSSLFNLGFGKKNSNGDELHETISHTPSSVSATPQKNQHSKFFRPSKDSEKVKPSSSPSMETSTSSMPNNGSVFPFMNGNNVEQLDLWNVQGASDFGTNWNVSSQTPAQASVTSSNPPISSPLSDTIKKVSTNSQRSVASSQVIDEEHESFIELGSDIGVPTQKVFTNKSFTNSIKSRGSHSADGSTSSSFFRNKFLGGISDQTKSPNKPSATTAKIDDSDLEEYNPVITTRKTSIFSSSSHSSKKKSRKQSSSSNEENTNSINQSSGNGSGSGTNEQGGSLKSFRRLSLFNGRGNTHSKDDE